MEDEEKCFLIVDRFPGVMDIKNEAKLRENIEKGNKEMKLKCLRALILDLTNGIPVQKSVLMTVIRFLLPSTDHDIKRMLLLFWELVPKTTPKGTLITEMILVVDSYRKDLEHPNEYIRSFTLRFICKLQSTEMLESLLPSIKGCLTHTSNFVRRNAIVALFVIYKKFPELVSNAPQLIMSYLQSERDSSCIRNAFIMLIQADKDLAVVYLKQCLPRVLQFDGALQLVMTEVMFKASLAPKSMEKSLFIPVLAQLVSSTLTSNAVKYEAANALLVLTPSPHTLQQVVQCFVELLFKESDNNIRLAVLAKIKHIVTHCKSAQLKRVLASFSLDILSLLSLSSDDVLVDIHVARRVVSVVVESLTADVDLCLKATQLVSREILKLQSRIEVGRRCVSIKRLSSSENHIIQYLDLLVDTLYHFTKRFSQVSYHTIPVLVDSIHTSHKENALKIVALLKLHMQRTPQDIDEVLQRLMESLDFIQNIHIFQAVLCLFMVYCNKIPITLQLLDKLQMLLLDVSGDGSSGTPIVRPKDHKSLVGADGAYVSQSSLLANSHTPAVRGKFSDHLKELLVVKNSSALSLLTFISFLMVHAVLRVATQINDSSIQHHLQHDKTFIINKIIAQAIFVITTLLELFSNGKNFIKGLWREKTYANLEALLTLNRLMVSRNCDMFQQKVAIFDESFKSVATLQTLDNLSRSFAIESLCDEVDQLMLSSPLFESVESIMHFDAIVLDENQPTTYPSPMISPSVTNGSSKHDVMLDNVVPLTGVCDPIYVEALLRIKPLEVFLDLLVVNRTHDTLQNVVLEVASSGKHASVNKSNPIVLPPLGYSAVKMSIKMHSLESGALFGSVFFDVTGSHGDRNSVVLDPIRIDMADDAKPIQYSHEDFISKWKVLDWENTIHIRTECTDMAKFVANIISSTNMTNLTAKEDMSGECNFLVCNLGIKTCLGEEAFANVSMEQVDFNNSPVTGNIRIRAASEKMVLNMGDKFKHCMTLK